MTISIEFNEQGTNHRLVDSVTHEATAWASYTQYTFLNGMVGVTAYFVGRESVMTVVDFMKRTAVNKA